MSFNSKATDEDDFFFFKLFEIPCNLIPVSCVATIKYESEEKNALLVINCLLPFGDLLDVHEMMDTSFVNEQQVKSMLNGLMDMHYWTRISSVVLFLC